VARTIFPLGLLALLLLLAAPGRAVAPDGEQRLLVLRLTWGPETADFSDATIAASVERASTHIRAASYGRTWVTHDTTPWLHVWSEEPRTCDYGPLYAFTTEVAQRSGYDLSRYSHTVFVFPRIEACRWGGSYYQRVIWINWVIPWTTLAHELGHTYGVPEEGPALVAGVPRNYANPYTVMGRGQEDFSAWEKWRFGWLQRVTRTQRSGRYSIDALESPSTRSQALVVPTARTDYWFEYRPAHGVLVYSGRDVLRGLVRGTFRVRGAFEARVVSRDDRRAVVAIRRIGRNR
jgi:Gametolysin peptidase M11